MYLIKIWLPHEVMTDGHWCNKLQYFSDPPPKKKENTQNIQAHRVKHSGFVGGDR